MQNVVRPASLLAAAIAVSALMSACAERQGTTRAQPPRAPREYRIGVDDVVEVVVWKEPELATTAPVRPDGKIWIPLAGEVTAAEVAREWGFWLALFAKEAHRAQTERDRGASNQAQPARQRCDAVPGWARNAAYLTACM